MREATGDLWDYLKVGGVIVITTNGQLNKDGANVMGRGCAREAKLRSPWIGHTIGRYIQMHGNRCFKIDIGMQVGVPPPGPWTLVTMPTKHHWREDSDPGLILQSTEQLVEMADKFGWAEVAMPRPGCGNGKLRWVDVKEMIKPMLDDRFLVLSK